MNNREVRMQKSWREEWREEWRKLRMQIAWLEYVAEHRLVLNVSPPTTNQELAAMYVQEYPAHWYKFKVLWRLTYG